MIHRSKSYVSFLLILLFSVAAFPAFSQLQFVENKGQWNQLVKYKSDIQSGAVFLEKNGFTVLQYNEKDLKDFSEFMHGHVPENKNDIHASNGNQLLRSHVYKVKMIGATEDVKSVPEKILPTYNNYYLGNDKSKWQSGCKIYEAVTYKNVYPNIDVRYYTDAGTLKYDFIIYPGGNANDILLQYEGAEKLYVKNRELIVQTSVGEVKELYPYTYQVLENSREQLDCKYVVKNNTVKFKIKNHDPGAIIVIDPTLIFSTLTGSLADNWGYTSTPGPDGSFYAGGIVFGNGFPVSAGAFSQSFNGGIDEDGNGKYDISLIKLSANGRNRLYATYLGGNGNEQPHSLISDASGNLILAGRSNSADFPVTDPLIGAGGGYDIIITKFNSTGTSVIGSVKIGGNQDDGVNIKPKYIAVTPGFYGAIETRRNYGDDARSEVILDGFNNVFLVSCTQSTNFPVRNSLIQNTFGGGRQDGVILKFSDNLSNLLFSSFFGGSGSDACFVLSINPLTGNVYIAGGTTSTDLPGNKAGVITPAFQGGVTDGFITEIQPDGLGIIKTTYAGTSGADLIYGIQFDKLGFPYITGTTTGNWPVLNAAFSNPGSKQFITKLKDDLSSIIYSTTFGTVSSIPNISITAFLVDRCQNVYVSGWGGNFNNQRGYPCAGTAGMSVTANAIKSITDGKDFYFFVLEKNAQRQLFGSFFGQNNGFDDHVDGGTSRFDANGVIYQAICANCGKDVFFPTTPGAWSGTNGSSNCNEACVKIEMNFTGIGASIRASIDGIIDTVGCVPLTVRFVDTLAKGKKYLWNFGDGTPPTSNDLITFAPDNSTSHLYNNVGTYLVRVISIDSATCNIVDTAFITVKVGNNIVVPKFNPVKLPPCTNLTFSFTNTTTATAPRYTPQTFLWDFGDNSPKQRADFVTVTHTYAAPGTYKVRLLVDDTAFCNQPVFFDSTIRLAVNVKAQATVTPKICLGYSTDFINTSLGGTDFIWYFGDGDSSKAVNPVHTYTATGTYTVRLVAIDTSTCNKRDETSFQVTVFSIPTANFSFAPQPAQSNTPTQFTNQSIGANRYFWDFGDGETSTAANPKHQFNATGTFNVMLVAFNEANCSDTIILRVPAIVSPVLDVPNAFTPGKFGENGLIRVYGFGIGKMDWKIYNRWGQVVFATTNRKESWDGTFKGALQPMDVYTYTLDVVFTDGKPFRKTGDITLLR